MKSIVLLLSILLKETAFQENNKVIYDHNEMLFGESTYMWMNGPDYIVDEYRS